MNYFNYFTEIEETFIRRRGRSLFLSPIDWAMMEDWKQRGVPLHVVIRGIETVFDGYDKNPGPRTIKGLLYCREEIEAQFIEWSAMQAGRPKDGNGDVAQHGDLDAVRKHIEKAIEALESTANDLLREDFERASMRLATLAENLSDNFESIDGALSDVEKLLDAALLTKSDKSRLKELRKEVASMLKPYRSTMEPEAYERTSELMLLKRLREIENVPRLGLFYL